MRAVLDGLWQFGRMLFIRDEVSGEERAFRGFLEPLNLTAVEREKRSRAGVVQTEKFRLIAEPDESFSGGRDRLICSDNCEFEIIRIKELYYGDIISHRECILLRRGGEEK